MWYHGASKSSRRLHSRDMLRLIEAFHTDWDNEYTRDNTRLFIANKAVAAASDSCSPEVQNLAQKFQSSLTSDRTVRLAFALHCLLICFIDMLHFEGRGSRKILPNVKLASW